jgi:hypothetical protein
MVLGVTETPALVHHRDEVTRRELVLKRYRRTTF